MSAWKPGDKVFLDMDLGKKGGWTRGTSIAATVIVDDGESVLVDTHNAQGRPVKTRVPLNHPRVRIRRAK